MKDCNVTKRQKADAARGVLTSAQAVAFVRRTCPCDDCRRARSHHAQGGGAAVMLDQIATLNADTAPKLYERIRNGDEEEYNFHDETVVAALILGIRTLGKPRDVVVRFGEATFRPHKPIWRFKRALLVERGLPMALDFAGDGEVAVFGYEIPFHLVDAVRIALASRPDEEIEREQS